MTTRASPSISPFKTAISKVDKALRPSPSAKSAIAPNKSSSMRISRVPKPSGSANARFNNSLISSVVKACKTKTLQRDSKAPLISKDGFSVVAPMRTMLPFSTKGKNASCCALLKRCISSTKRIVFSP